MGKLQTKSRPPRQTKKRRETSPRRTTPRQYSLVRFVTEDMPKEYREKYPFTPTGIYVFFGEIPNMPGHCVVACHKTGLLFSGYHTENFAELSDAEI